MSPKISATCSDCSGPTCARCCSAMLTPLYSSKLYGALAADGHPDRFGRHPRCPQPSVANKTGSLVLGYVVNPQAPPRGRAYLTSQTGDGVRRFPHALRHLARHRPTWRPSCSWERSRPAPARVQGQAPPPGDARRLHRPRAGARPPRLGYTSSSGAASRPGWWRTAQRPLPRGRLVARATNRTRHRTPHHAAPAVALPAPAAAAARHCPHRLGEARGVLRRRQPQRRLR
jgi:hypothetical protein